MLSRIIYLATLAIVAAAGLPAQAANQSNASPQPSFNCARATSEIDKAICADPGLAEADSTMARLYAAARVSAFGTGPSNQLEAQRKWLMERADCRVVQRVYKSRADCLAGYYRDRNHALAVAALFTERSLALDTLRKIDPEAAPLYEAITHFANQPVGSDWTSPSLAPKRIRMLELLGGYSDRLRTDEAQGYGKDILKDSGIEGPGDPLRSEQKFAEFIQVASAYLEGDPTPRPMPCAAIVKHPGLLDATAAAFGSTLDNFILYPDCEETLPPLPKLTGLAEISWKTWPECQGTIRFMFYRSFSYKISAARLGLPVEDATVNNSATAMPRRKGIPPKLVEEAIAELAAYYRKYQRALPDGTQALAAARVRDMMGAAHQCEIDEG